MTRDLKIYPEMFHCISDFFNLQSEFSWGNFIILPSYGIWKNFMCNFTEMFLINSKYLWKMYYKFQEKPVTEK